MMPEGIRETWHQSLQPGAGPAGLQGKWSGLDPDSAEILRAYRLEKRARLQNVAIKTGSNLLPQRPDR